MISGNEVTDICKNPRDGNDISTQKKIEPRVQSKRVYPRFNSGVLVKTVPKCGGGKDSVFTPIPHEFHTPENG